MVLPLSDWTRIREQLLGVDRQAQAQKLRQQQREEKHAKSKSVVQNWGNTIDGQRLKRLQTMKLKNEKEEVATIEQMSSLTSGPSYLIPMLRKRGWRLIGRRWSTRLPGERKPLTVLRHCFTTRLIESKAST